MSQCDQTMIAIHHRSGSFSDRWMEYCKENGIRYELVNCYANDIVEHLEAFDALLWNWHQSSYRDVRAAPPVICAAEQMGLVVFPSTATCRTFDSKLAQKYQLESIGAPLVPTYVFFDEDTAVEWLVHTSFPKVFKLSCGAGAVNVRLVKNAREGKALVKRAFRQGFNNASVPFRDTFGMLSSAKMRSKCKWREKIKRLPSTLWHICSVNRMMGREIGYIYFQEFIPNLKHDTRVVIIGDRAFAFQREVRPKDFRASGSGLTITNPDKIDMEFVRLGFEVSRRLNLQSAAYDFIRGGSGFPYLIEVSYTFPANKTVKDCPGHWDRGLKWHEGNMWPQDAILMDVLHQIKLGPNSRTPKKCVIVLQK